MQQPPNTNPQNPNIPSEEQRVIDELVGLWQTSYVPRDLITHLDRVSGSWGSGKGASFFQHVYEDLRTEKRSKYAAASASEFKRFLEAEYRQQIKAHVERQAQVMREEREEYERRAKAREENERRARADFDALGELMEKTTDRKERIEISQKREDLAPYIGIRHPYENHCWNCPSRISSTIHAQCPNCKWYICSTCGSCKPNCDKTYHPFHNGAGDPFLPDYPDDLS